MKNEFLQLNLALAWLWILFGFISGLVLGLFFRGENWLGGYASFKRRMYRLGHISFFGLGAVNLMFWLTLRNYPLPDCQAHVASWAFIIGAFTMPVCCLVIAHFPRVHLIFAVPVVSLVLGGLLTLTLIVHPSKVTGTAITSSTTQPSTISLK
jgi:hypothetical protein